jgi:chromosome segregation ATPase
MEWAEGRITKRCVDVAKAPESAHPTVGQAYSRADELELASAREKILELKYEIEALRGELSDSHVERLKAELSVAYAANRGVRRKLEDEMEENARLNAGLKYEKEENEKLNAGLRHERQENEKLNAGLRHERQENQKLNAELKREREETEKLNAGLKQEREGTEELNAGLRLALLANGSLVEQSRSLREQADGLRAVLEIVADRLERWPCPLRSPEFIESDDVQEK